jgi:PAS domain S-box-containing protein
MFREGSDMVVSNSSTQVLSDDSTQFLLTASRILAEFNRPYRDVLGELAVHVSQHFDAVSEIVIGLPDAEFVTPVAVHHHDPEVVSLISEAYERHKVRLGEGIVGRVIHGGKEVWMPSVPAELRDRVRVYTPKLIPESALYAPMVTRTGVLGSMNVVRLEGRPALTDSDRSLIEQLAEQSALFVDNVWLNDQQQRELKLRRDAQESLEKALRVNAFLLRTSRLLSDLSSDRSQVLDALTAEVSRHFDVFCVIYMMSADGIGLSPRAVHHYRPDVLQALRSAFEGNGTEDGMRAARHVVRSNEPFIVQDASSEGVLTQSIDPLLTPSAYGFWPLRSDEPIGALCLCKLKGQAAFSDEELSGITHLSSHLSLFMTNMLMHDRQQLEIEARTVAEQQLVAKEGELRQILNAIPINISRIGKNLRYRFLNESYTRMGIDPEEMVGRHIRDVLGERGLMQVMPKIERTLAGEMLNYDETVTMANGKTRHFSVVVAPDRDHRNKVVGFYSCTIDVTEKVEFERNLRISEDRYRSLLLNSGDAFCLHDLNGRILDVNTWATELTGHNRDELLRMNAAQLDAGWLSGKYEALLASLRPDLPVTHEAILTHKNGHRFPVEIRLVKRVEEGNELIQALIRDRSEKHEQELLLRKSEERLRVLIDNVQDVIMTVDYHGTILSINRTKQGTRPEDVIGTSIFDNLKGEQGDKVRAELEIAKQTSVPFEVVARFRGPDGTTEWYQTMYCPVNDADILVAVSRNITHIKESELHLMNGITKGQEQERKRLGAELHDGVGQLLSSIALEVSQLKNEEQITAELENALTGISRRVTHAIDEIRNISHDLMPGLLESFGLVEAIKGVCRNIQARSGIHFHFDAVDIDSVYNPELEVNLYRIVQELVNNVVRHAHCSRVYINLIDYGDMVSLSVEDDGVGFDSSELQNGIGLSNIRSRVSILGGNVSVESSNTSGTLVHIEVPKIR